MTGLRRSATRSAFWAGIEASSVSLFSFIVLLALARLLTPADFGTAAIALSIVQIIAVVAEFLFHDAIVHRAGLTQQQADSAHTVTVIAGLLLAVLIFMASFIPIVGIFFAGALATLVTLGAKGPIYALIFVGILLVEQQLENHVLQPLIVGRALHFHPLAIIIVLAVGGILDERFGAPDFFLKAFEVLT